MDCDGVLMAATFDDAWTVPDPGLLISGSIKDAVFQQYQYNWNNLSMTLPCVIFDGQAADIFFNFIC